MKTALVLLAALLVGASSKTYVPIGSDVNLRIRVRVTGSNTSGSSSAVSAATAQIKQPH